MVDDGSFKLPSGYEQPRGQQVRTFPPHPTPHPNRSILNPTITDRLLDRSSKIPTYFNITASHLGASTILQRRRMGFLRHPKSKCGPFQLVPR